MSNTTSPYNTLGNPGLSSNVATRAYVNQSIASSSISNTRIKFSAPGSDTLLTIYDKDDNTLVEMDSKGVVTWGDDVDVNDAASSFATMLRYAAVEAHGVTDDVRQEIFSKGRDQAFEEIMQHLEEGKTLSVQDLTYIRDSVKVVHELSGSKWRWK
jgi:hypothetical protein